MNRRSFLLALGGSAVDQGEACSQPEVNQALRAIETQLLSPRQRNREWNILVERFKVFSCRLLNVNLELKKIELQPQVVSLGVKRAIAAAELALKALCKGFGDVKDLT